LQPNKKGVTAMSYEHEFKRFSSMTLSKCYTRLDRITKSDKLREFISMAGEFKYWDLQEKAKAKLNVLLGKPAETPRMVGNLLKEKRKEQLSSCTVCAKKIIRNGQTLCVSCKKKLPFWKPKEGENIIEIIPNETIEREVIERMVTDTIDKVKMMAEQDELEKNKEEIARSFGVPVSKVSRNGTGWIIDRRVSPEKKEKPKSNGGLKRFLDF